METAPCEQSLRIQRTLEISAPVSLPTPSYDSARSSSDWKRYSSSSRSSSHEEIKKTCCFNNTQKAYYLYLNIGQSTGRKEDVEAVAREMKRSVGSDGKLCVLRYYNQKRLILQVTIPVLLKNKPMLLQHDETSTGTSYRA